MIEIMVYVRDTDTGKHEHHLTHVLCDAADIDGDGLSEVRRETGQAVTAAVRRLQGLAQLTNYYEKLGN